MKNNSEDSGNNNLLQRFAVKAQKKKAPYVNKISDGNRAVIYNRCSDTHQDSLGWQEKISTDFCKKNNWVLVKCFGEKETATTDEREEFIEMQKFCEEENISHIIFYSYDRFSRTGGFELLNTLRQKGIKIHAATQSVDDSTPSGRFSQKLYLLFAQMENEQRRDRIIEGQKNKLRKGEWIGAPTIGYEKRYLTGKKEHDFDRPQCFIAENGKHLKQAFLWKCHENLSNVEIVKRLSPMGVTLTLQQLTRIFRNPFYCGYITSTLLDEGELIRGKHDPLVSEEVFLKVNGVVNRKPHGWKMLKQNNEMPLKASVKCGICDRPLTAYPQKGKYIYYKCPNTGCCVNISNKKLHQLFADELLKFAIHPQLIPVIKNQLEATYWKLHNNETAREKPMKDELTRLKNELETMEFNLATSKINFEIFQKFSSAHLQKIKSIEDELGNLVRNTSNFETYLNTALKYASNLLEMWLLLDCENKVRLQKLVYPDGLRYLQENHALRTSKINPVFSAITSISMDLHSEVSQDQGQKNPQLHQLYLMFTSSNFFWENLLEIQNQINEMEYCYPHMWDNMTYQYLNPVTGSTEFVRFNYTSNLTGTEVYHNQNQNLYLGYSNTFTGTTNHLSSTQRG